MEASKERSAAAERLAALVARYPEDKFIWIMPRLDLAGDLPEHLDFMVSTRKLHSGDIYTQGAGVALKKSALMALAADAGLKWVSHLSRRTDDGSNPDIVEWQSTAMIADLGGLTPITRSKRIDLNLARMRDRAKKKTDADMAKDDMQRQQFKCEMAESGAATRVVRDALGIPNVFDIEDIKNKEFAILRVILSPKARTPDERKLILGRMMDQYMPAFPTATAEGQAVLIEAAPDRPRIEAPRPIPEEIEFTIDDEPSEPAEVQQSAGGDSSAPTAIPRQGEVVTHPVSDSQPQQARQSSSGGGDQPLKTPSLPLEDDPPPPLDSSKPVTFIRAMQSLKTQLIELLGTAGETEYYDALKAAGYKKSNEVLDRKAQAKIYRDLEARVKLLQTNAAAIAPAPASPAEPTDPLTPFIQQRRESLGRMSIERLSTEIDGMLKNYPRDNDPLDIIPRFAATEDKPKLIEIAMELFDWQVRESARIRDLHNTTRGGER